MLFNSAVYLAFLPLVAVLNWSLPPRARPAFLLVASYVFYAAWSAPFLLLIGGLTAVNFVLGRVQGRLSPRSRALLVAAVAANLGTLVVFKYLGLLDDTAHALAGAFGLATAPSALRIILPLGLSFFTFEFIHYQVDLYRGHAPITDPVRFALFPAFFPTQIAGPIKRFQDFDRQVGSYPRFDPRLALEGVELVALGLFKKVVLADNLLPVADRVFSAPGTATWLDAWVGLIAFSFQIYLDFSGYTDVGRGSAQIVGYRVPVNFVAPYLATSLRDFWRRWHISLSSWLRDYLYIPLGGGRKGERRTRANLIATMALGGLWHGASWHFLLWGLGHGGVLAAERWWPFGRVTLPPRAWLGMRWATTQLLVLGLWSLFRAPDLGTVAMLWSRMLVPDLLGATVPGAGLAVAIAVGVLVVEALPEGERPVSLARSSPLPALTRPFLVVGLGGAAAVAAALAGATHRFIYFQF